MLVHSPCLLSCLHPHLRRLVPSASIHADGCAALLSFLHSAALDWAAARVCRGGPAAADCPLCEHPVLGLVAHLHDGEGPALSVMLWQLSQPWLRWPN